MADILIRGYKAKEQIEDIIKEARYAANNCMIGSGLEIVELPEHGDLIDRDALTKEINERIDAAIKWGVNAIADRDAEIKLRAEQTVATFCEASLTSKKLPTIIQANKEETE